MTSIPTLVYGIEDDYHVIRHVQPEHSFIIRTSLRSGLSSQNKSPLWVVLSEQLWVVLSEHEDRMASGGKNKKYLVLHARFHVRILLMTLILTQMLSLIFGTPSDSSSLGE